MSLMNLVNGTKKYRQEGEELLALDRVSLEINRGEIIVILGASGSGKTTLLNVLAGLDQLDEGGYSFDGASIIKLDQHQITALRKDHFGFIFQSYNLLENLDVIQNVKIGSMLNKSVKDDDVLNIIKLVGLEDRKNSGINELSGGQQQRVAIARALAKKPDVLFCDEPTGALDEYTSKEILKLMLDLNEKLNTTMVLVTHNPIIANIADKVLVMRDGRIESLLNNERKDILNIEWSL
jgi:ABC-type antimicrobial peptide transport system, ATPase component